MDRKLAAEQIASTNLHERLQAARFYSRFARRDDYEVVSAALGRESVVWIRDALRRALEVVQGTTDVRATEVQPDAATEDEVVEDIYAEAVEETTRRLVHELEPILGTIRYYAGQEVPNYQQSRIRHQLDRLESLLQAIDTLSKAASPPAMKEFDLPRLIDAVSDSVRVGYNVTVSLAGRRPLVAHGDPSLVELVVANGLRNALEATLASSQGGEVPPVVVNWDETDRDFYVAVLDRGPGLPLGFDRAFEIGRTTKKGHLGMGLALADRAARTVRGRISVTPRGESGVSYEFRWPRSIGHSP